MKTKEFIKKVEELGFETDVSERFVNILSDGLQVAYVLKDQVYALECNLIFKIEFMNMDKLFDLLVEYARTPVEEREEEKRYYLRHRWIFKDEPGYLLYGENNLDYALGVKDICRCGYKSIFTDSDIESIKEKYNTNLSDFEMVEVEE